MEIKTKFNLYDTIFTIIGRNIIAERTIKAIIYQDDNIYYSAGNLDISYAEGSCFATKEEAQKECERRNEKNL